MTTNPDPSHQPSTAFRIGAYLGDHLIEAAALSATLAAALSYAVGRSFLDGWAQAAGIPPSLFQSDLYEAIFTGVKLRSVWQTALIVGALGAAYTIVCLVAPDVWASRHRGRPLVFKATRMREAHGWGQRGLRSRLAGEAFLARQGTNRESFAEGLRWKALGPRRTRKIDDDVRVKLGSLVLGVFGLAIALICTLLSLYKLLDSSLMVPARQDGINRYAKVYLAVTGRVPNNFSPSELSSEERQEWACEGRAILAQYRAVRIAPDSGSSESAEAFYVIQGVDKLFVFLGEKGSVLRSFGDGPFSLPESPVRPLSTIAKNC